MKILFLANKDLASNYALNLLLPKLRMEHELHLWLSARVGGNVALPKELSKLKFFEQDLFNELLCPLLSNANAGGSRFKSFEGLAAFLATELREENSINGDASVNKMVAIAPDVIVSIRFGGILKETCIKLPRFGVLNLHSGILPSYRGVMATFWALLNNEKKIGTTLHTIDDSSIDTGKIIQISTMNVNRERSYLSQVLSLYEQGSEDILEALNSLQLDHEPAKTKQKNKGTYYSFPKDEDLLAFKQQGFELIDEQAYLTFLQTHYL